MKYIGHKILFLGKDKSPLLKWLISVEEFVMQTSEKITTELIHSNNINFIVSYDYGHILGKDILDLFHDRAINLHIAYLPFNRGADPDLWSFIENTPRGVTIHYMDEGIDTGDIIVQEKVKFDIKQDSLATSHEKLHLTIQDLFKKNWQDIKTIRCKRQKQVGNGTFHKAKDKISLNYLLEDGWDTPLYVLEKIRNSLISKENIKSTFPIKVSKPISVDLLAESIGNCQIIKFDNNVEYLIDSVSGLNNADKQSIICCWSYDISEIETAVNKTNANIIIVSKEIVVPPERVIIVTEDPLEWFIKSLGLLLNTNEYSGVINRSAIIDKNTSIGQGVSIGAGTVIKEGCVIGNNSSIGCNCVLEKNVIVGEKVFIQNNVTIGSVGLAYHFPNSEWLHAKTSPLKKVRDYKRVFFPHLGSVIIGNDVVIGSGCVIVRGQLQDTVIHEGSILGNLVNVGHNVIIERNCSISSSTSIAGGVLINKNCNIAVGLLLTKN